MKRYKIKVFYLNMNQIQPILIRMLVVLVGGQVLLFTSWPQNQLHALCFFHIKLFWSKFLHMRSLSHPYLSINLVSMKLKHNILHNLFEQSQGKKKSMCFRKKVVRRGALLETTMSVNTTSLQALSQVLGTSHHNLSHGIVYELHLEMDV